MDINSKRVLPMFCTLILHELFKAIFFKYATKSNGIAEFPGILNFNYNICKAVVECVCCFFLDFRKK